MADGPDKTAGAAQVTEPVKTDAGGATQQAPQQGKEGQTVPLAALVGEQENTKKAREEALRYRTHLELHGFGFDEQGNPIAPAAPVQVAPQPQPTAVDPETAELASSIGVDPEKLQRVIDKRVVQTGGRLLDPVTRQGFEQSEWRAAQEDPDFPIYAKTYREEVDKRVKNLPPEYQPIARTHPDLLSDARAAAKSKHWNELVTKAVERKAAEATGKVRGTFTEGVQPSSAEAPQITLSAGEEATIAEIAASDGKERADAVRANLVRIKTEKMGGR